MDQMYHDVIEISMNIQLKEYQFYWLGLSLDIKAQFLKAHCRAISNILGGDLNVTGLTPGNADAYSHSDKLKQCMERMNGLNELNWQWKLIHFVANCKPLELAIIGDLDSI